jgi:Domain of unknown function (DUF5667)/Domain of unknown function (DUF5666)
MPLRTFDSILDECLLRMQQGGDLEVCLDAYPDHADRLRPLLTLADQVRQTPPSLPRPWPQSITWQRVKQRADDLRVPAPAVRLEFPLRAWLRPVAITAALLAAFFGITGGTALAAQNSLPDSPLYRVKLATEEVRLLLVFNETQEAEILMEQSDERMDEILTMARQDKPIPGNALSALRNRNERAARILSDHPEEADLLATFAQQSESHESRLIVLFPEVSRSAYDDYTETVAAVHNARLSESDGFVGIQPEELSAGVLHISGVAQQVGTGLWTVGGVEVRVDQTTIGATNLTPGSTARLVVGKNSRGQLRALTSTTVQTDLPPSGSVVSGEIEQVTEQGIVIGGQLIPITPDTIRTGKLAAKQKVEVKLGRSETGVVASTVRPAPVAAAPEVPAQLTFEGVIEGNVSTANDEWKIGGLTFQITPNTDVDAQGGEAKDGARVIVEASVSGEELLAHSVTVLASGSNKDAAFMIGTFEDSDEGVWRVSGLEVVPPERLEEPQPGTLMAIDLRRREGELEVQGTTVIQDPDDPGLVRLSGAISQLEGAFWTLDFATVRVASTADFAGPEAEVGVRALVWGKQNQNAVFEATYARVLDENPVLTTPSPAPSPSPTP